MNLEMIETNNPFLHTSFLSSINNINMSKRKFIHQFSPNKGKNERFSCKIDKEFCDRANTDNKFYVDIIRSIKSDNNYHFGHKPLNKKVSHISPELVFSSKMKGKMSIFNNKMAKNVKYNNENYNKKNNNIIFINQKNDYMNASGNFFSSKAHSNAKSRYNNDKKYLKINDQRDIKKINELSEENILSPKNKKHIKLRNFSINSNLVKNKGDGTLQQSRGAYNITRGSPQNYRKENNEKIMNINIFQGNRNHKYKNKCSNDKNKEKSKNKVKDKAKDKENNNKIIKLIKIPKKNFDENCMMISNIINFEISASKNLKKQETKKKEMDRSIKKQNLLMVDQSDEHDDSDFFKLKGFSFNNSADQIQTVKKETPRKSLFVINLSKDNKCNENNLMNQKNNCGNILEVNKVFNSNEPSCLKNQNINNYSNTINFFTDLTPAFRSGKSKEKNINNEHPSNKSLSLKKKKMFLCCIPHS